MDNTKIAIDLETSKYISIPKVYKDVEPFEFCVVNNENYLRVTSILNHWTPPRLRKFIATNSANAGEKKLQSAGAIGSAVHKQIELNIDPSHLSPQEMKLYENAKSAFLKFKSEVDWKPIASEITLASPSLGVSGTIDSIGMYDGVLTLVDWKSGFVGESARWQTSCYKYLFEETYNEPIRVIVVKLDKQNGTYFAVKYINYDMSLRAYTGLLHAYADTHYKALMTQWKWWNKDFSNIKHKEFNAART